MAKKTPQRRATQKSETSNLKSPTPSIPPAASSAPAPAPAPLPGVALIAIDLQPIFLKSIANGDTVLRRSQFAIAAARGLGIPIFFTEQLPAKLGPTDAPTRVLAPDAPVLGKSAFSALDDSTGLLDTLHRHSIEHLLLCGIETPICVYQTAIDAIGADLQVTLLTDAIGARRPDDARAALAALDRAGAHLLPAETVYYSILRDASHPFFKTYTQLVKNHG
ncbi:isochorismatase family protein [Geminisphaera colitermitum]|uniref:isochorismatase family protein n=1 Tax=Geminisphaera colitermitum TaxID=1148786 RepID=UPI000158DFFC|nr:isochorismatase family protein [Geminisphaera colitermitum]